MIADITRRMGAGMAEFIQKDEVVTLAEYDLYCHYVAGLVGVGLSQLFGEARGGAAGQGAPGGGRGGCTCTCVSAWQRNPRR